MSKKENLRLFTSIIHSSHSIHKKSRKLKRGKVCKMLAVMEAQQAAGSSNGANVSTLPPNCSTMHTDEFLASGRTGRRNALPDILGEHALVTSSDLPIRLQSLSTSDPVQGPSSNDISKESNKPNS